MALAPICSICGDKIGVYEPLVVNEAGQLRISALAVEAGLADGEADLSHKSCRSLHAHRGDDALIGTGGGS